MTDMPCPVCGEMHQCGGTFEGDDDDFERMSCSLDDAACDAMDNLPCGWELTVVFRQEWWHVELTKDGEWHHELIIRANDDDESGLTSAITEAVDRAREKEGLPT